MLALTVSLTLALYVLGPDVVLRLVVSFFAPAKAKSSNRTEEIARASMLSLILLTVVYSAAHFGFHRFYNTAVLKDFLLGLYGDSSLEKHSDAFYAAATTVVRINLVFLLLPIYGFVLLWSIALGLIIRKYGRLSRWAEKHPKTRAVLAFLVRPWVAEWHLKLSGTLLPKPTDYIQADILTKINILFRGTLIEPHLGADGGLVSLTLASPRKFKREELLLDRAAEPGTKLDSSLYWSEIVAQSFIIMASEIVTLNLNYIDPTSLKKKPTRVTPVGAKKALEVARRANTAKLTKSNPREPGQSP